MDRIKDHGTHMGVPISQDFNVYGEQVYLGNGQGCGTFWFRTVDEARKFIEAMRRRIKVTDIGCVNGLIPKKVCKECRGHYSYGTRAWKNRTRDNCKDVKEEMKAQVLRVERWRSKSSTTWSALPSG